MSSLPHLFGPDHSPAAFTDTVREAVRTAVEHDLRSDLIIVATPSTDREAVLAGVRRGDYGEDFLAEALAQKLSPQAQALPCDEDEQENRTARSRGVPAVSLMDPSAGRWDWQNCLDTTTGIALENAAVVLDLTLTTAIEPTGQPWDSGIRLAPAHPVKRYSVAHHGQPTPRHHQVLQNWIRGYGERGGTDAAATALLNRHLASIEEQQAALAAGPDSFNGDTLRERIAAGHCPTELETRFLDLRGERQAVLELLQ